MIITQQFINKYIHFSQIKPSILYPHISNKNEIHFQGDRDQALDTNSVSIFFYYQYFLVHNFLLFFPLHPFFIKNYLYSQFQNEYKIIYKSVPIFSLLLLRLKRVFFHKLFRLNRCKIILLHKQNYHFSLIIVANWG